MQVNPKDGRSPRNLCHVIRSPDDRLRECQTYPILVKMYPLFLSTHTQSTKTYPNFWSKLTQNIFLDIRISINTFTFWVKNVIFTLVKTSVMSKSVGPKDLTDKISFGLTKFYIPAAYFIVLTDKTFKISPNDWHAQKDFNISETYPTYISK